MTTTATVKREQVVITDTVKIKFSTVSADPSANLVVLVDPDGDIVLASGACRLFLCPEHVPAVMAALVQALAEALKPVAPVTYAYPDPTQPSAPQPLAAAVNDF